MPSSTEILSVAYREGEKGGVLVTGNLVPVCCLLLLLSGLPLLRLRLSG